MLILCTDTSTQYACFALGTYSGELLSSHVFEHKRCLSQLFYAGLEKTLEMAETTYSKVSALAVGVGPGSFTGVRVGVTTMRTLAQVSGKSLVSTGTLQTYAEDAWKHGYDRTLAILPSRKHEVYCQMFVGGNPLADPTVMTFQHFELLLKEQASVTVCGQVSCLTEDFNGFNAFPQTAPPPAALIYLAAARVRNQQFDDPMSLLPVYAAPPAISQHKISR